MTEQVFVWRDGKQDSSIPFSGYNYLNLSCEYCQEHKQLRYIDIPGWPWYLHERCAKELGLIW